MGKHCYANPTDPTVCIVLWLAVYIATHEIWEETQSTDEGDNFQKNASVFPGDHTGSRMGKRLSKLIEQLLNDETIDDIAKAQVCNPKVLHIETNPNYDIHIIIRHMRKYLKIQKQRREQEAEE